MSDSDIVSWVCKAYVRVNEEQAKVYENKKASIIKNMDEIIKGSISCYFQHYLFIEIKKSITYMKYKQFN